jgi:hypothetical protein
VSSTGRPHGIGVADLRLPQYAFAPRERLKRKSQADGPPSVGRIDPRPKTQRVADGKRLSRSTLLELTKLVVFETLARTSEP